MQTVGIVLLVDVDNFASGRAPARPFTSDLPVPLQPQLDKLLSVPLGSAIRALVNKKKRYRPIFRTGFAAALKRSVPTDPNLRSHCMNRMLPSLSSGQTIRSVSHLDLARWDDDRGRNQL
jgi:hypothetical protein